MRENNFEYKDKCELLEKDVERLTKVNQEYQRINGELRKEIELLQQRIENATNFINGGEGWRKVYYTHQEKMLLNILKGVDKNVC